MRYWLAVLMMAASPTVAQDLVYDDAVLGACLAALDPTQPLMDCAGVAANKCVEESRFVKVPLGKAACMHSEAQSWLARLDVAFTETLAMMRAEEAANAAENVNIPAKSAALTALHESWTAFRGNKCEYDRAEAGGGNHGGYMMAYCEMVETAEQAAFMLLRRDMACDAKGGC